MSRLLACSCCCGGVWLRREQHKNGQAALWWEQPHLRAELEVWACRYSKLKGLCLL